MADAEQDRDLPSLLHTIDLKAYARQQLWAGKNAGAGGAELARRLAEAYAALDRAAEAAFSSRGAGCMRGEPTETEPCRRARCG